MAHNPKNLSVPEAMRSHYKEIITLTDGLCQQKLTDEYALLCRQLTATLTRKRPSPLIAGKAEAWACGIVYTIGFVNFLFDKTQTPHISADELCTWFRISKSTGGNKAKQISTRFNKIPVCFLQNAQEIS